MQFLAWIQHPVTLAVIAAIPGAIHGFFAGRQRALWRGVSDALTAIIFAVVVAELFTPDDKPVVALLIGLVAGRTGSRALQAVEELVPDVVETIVMGWAKKVSGNSYEAQDTAPLEPHELIEGDEDAEDADDED